MISSLLDLMSRSGGSRLAFRIKILRYRRWRNVEPEWLLLDQLVDPKRAAVDAGANDGLYTGRMAQLTSLVHCFEPVPWLADALEQKLSSRARVHRMALSDHAGTAELRIPCDEAGQPMTALSTLEAANDLDGNARLRRVTCQLERLDSVVQAPVGFMKIDVEGHERAVLHGAQTIMARDRPIVLVESQRVSHPAAPGNIFAFFDALGYAGYFVDHGRLCSVADFRLERDQGPAEPGRKNVNNFIFTTKPLDPAAVAAALA